MLRRLRGFTLIELLIVIAIIALLLSISLPALRKVKEQARLLVCVSRVRQMGMSYSAYITDNNGKMCYNVSKTAAAHGVYNWKGSWVEVLRPYYSDKNEIRLCPSATKERDPAAGSTLPAPGQGLPTKYQAWGLKTNSILMNLGESREETGSYGFNSWLYQVLPEVIGQYPANYFWWTDMSANTTLWKSNIKNPSIVPVFTDSWYRGSAVVENAPPPNKEDDTDAVTIPAGHLGSTVCLNRHNGYIGGSFVDGSARKIGLKEIWRLRWHKSMNTNGPWTSSQNPAWPEWMSGFKDY